MNAYLWRQAFDILEECDLGILWDITEREGSTEENPLWKDVCYIGWPQELAAGIWGGSVSGCFDSAEDALTWLVSEYEQDLEEA